MASKGDIFKPGEKVPYFLEFIPVIHDTEHSEEHDVTCVYGKPFPPCNHCGHRVRFALKYAAQHIIHNENFK